MSRFQFKLEGLLKWHADLTLDNVVLQARPNQPQLCGTWVYENVAS